MNEVILTVLTPTYDRADRLAGLYHSLLAQTDGGFCWLIADDGSTDGTAALAAEWAAEGRLKVEYFRKENGGKHTAINEAMPRITTPLTVIVDSDDALAPDAVESIRRDWPSYAERKDICAAVYAKVTPDGVNAASRPLPADGLEESFVDCRFKRGIRGDMAEVFVTRCLREFPFPQFEGERFLSEDVVWLRMSERYIMRFYKQAIYIADYRPDGLSASRRRHNLASPRGCSLRGEVWLDAGLPLPYRIKGMLCYIVYGRFAGESMRSLRARSNHRALFWLCDLPSRVIYRRWRRGMEAEA